MKSLRLIASILITLFASVCGSSGLTGPAFESRPRLESRDGNSVDTATGAFLQNLNLITLQGSRALAFNIAYNSGLTTKRGYLGYGWSSPYEARIQGDPNDTVTVFLNGNIGNTFRFVAQGQPYQPLNEQNRYDELTRVTIGGFSGIWKLRRLGGTTYLFNNALTNDRLAGPVFQLLQVQDGTGKPVNVFGDGDGVTHVVVDELRIDLFYRAVGTPLLHYIVHGDDYTCFNYDANDRLTRVYNPLNWKTVVENKTITAVPEGPAGLSLNLVVGEGETGQLVRVRGGVTQPSSGGLTVTLRSPSGRTVPIHNLSTSSQLFLDDFINESPVGTWVLNIRDTINDGVTGTFNDFRLQRSTEKVTWTQYDYDPFPFNRITKATDAKGQRLYSLAYDANRRVAFQDDGRDDNGGWRFSYQAQPNGDLLTTVLDRTAAGNPTKYLHDNNYRLKYIEDALGRKTEYTYDFNGNRISMKDARNQVTSYDYDIKGNLTHTSLSNGASLFFNHDEFDLARADRSGTFNGGARGNLTSVIDPLGNKTTYHYDEYNNIIESQNALMNRNKQEYADNKLTSTTNKDGDEIVIDYNPQNLVSTANVAGETGDLSKLEYDDQGRVIVMIDADGGRSTFTFDLRGNVLEQSNAMGHKIKSVYDQRNRLISETDPRGFITRYEYDGNGNLTKTIHDALNQVTTYVYDAEDRMTRVTAPSGSNAQTEFNALGQVVRKIDEEGNSVTFTYDEVGNQTAMYGPRGELIQATTYNSSNLPLTKTNVYGHSTTFEYNLMGQVTAQIDGRGKRTEYRLDALARVDQVTDPTGRTFRKIYARDDVLEKLIDAADKETKYTYTKRNLVESITNPGGGVTRFEYNKRGQISRYTPPSTTKSQEYTYNAAGRLQRTKFTNSSPALPDRVFDFDANGNNTSVSTQSGASTPVPQITRTFDALNRQSSETDSGNRQVRNVYDSGGRLSQVIYPDNKTVSYAYDKAGQLISMTDWAGRVTLYKWNVFGKVISISFPNGTTRTMQYDGTGRLLSRADFDSSGTPIVSYQYAYDANGFVTTEGQHANTISYQPTATSFAYDNDNRMTQKGAFAVSNDTDGNVTMGPVGGVSTAFTWNYNNLLSQVGSLSFNYDAEDRLKGWQNGAESVVFTIVSAAGGSRVLVKESNVAPTTRYVYGVGLAYEEINGEIRVIHQDERGNTVALSDSAGAVSGRIAYSPYGEEISRTGVTDTIFKHGGLYGVITAPNGLNNMRFRWYSPEMKRFVSVDSVYGDISLPSTLNRYSYAGNNPINFNDPEGEFFNFIAVAVGAIGGAIINATIELVSSAIQGKPVDWGSVGAAAIGGFVAGGLAASGNPALGGLAGHVVESLTRSAIKGEPVDPLDLALGAAAGAIGGKLGSKLGSKLGTAFGKWRAGENIGKALNKLTRSAANNAARDFGKSFVSGAIGEAASVGASHLKEKIISSVMTRSSAVPAGYDGSGPSGRVGKIVLSAVSLPTATVGRGGEYLHSQLYLNALKEALRPAPDTTTRLSPF